MFNLLSKFVGSKKHTNRRPFSKQAQLAIECLEARELMTTTIVGSVLGTGPVQKINPAQGWIDQNIHDPAIHALVTSYDGDTVLSRNEMLDIFNQVRNDAYQHGLTATELSDLHALVNNPNIVGMPGYVANLANKVVNFDPADLHYQGSTLEVNAGLRVGDSGTLLNNLTNKWFLGQDHPALPNLQYSDTHTPIPVHYQLAAGSLFGNGIGYADIMQGGVADCFFVASLESAAVQRPAVITNMFIDNGDGTFTVRFYNNGTPDYVTVDRYLPADGNGNYVAANQTRSLSDSSNKLWVALAEKAYAQLAESGWSRPDHNTGVEDPTKEVNAYDSINWGFADIALPQVTGLQASNVSGFLRNGHPLTSADVISDFQHGALIVLTTDSVDPKTPSHVRADVVPSHVYPMISYFTSGNLLVLDNPWAPGDPTKSQTLVGTWEQMQDTGYDHIGWGFSSVVEVTFPSLPPGSPVGSGTGTVTKSTGAAAPMIVAASTSLPGTVFQNQVITHTSQSADQLPPGNFEVHSAMLYFQDLRNKSEDRTAVSTSAITSLFAGKNANRLGGWEMGSW